MGREEHRNGVTDLGTELFECGAKALGEGFDEERVARPARGEVNAQASRFGFDGAAVEAHAGARVLRCKAKDGGFFNAVGAHLAHHVGNIGTPVAHAHVDLDGLSLMGEFFFDQAGLLHGDLGERAAADERYSDVGSLRLRTAEGGGR